MILKRVIKKFFKRDTSEVDDVVDIKSHYDVVLHIGAPKTGSSALQKFFKTNKKQLEKHNFYYPEHGLDKNGISGGHSLLAIALIENREDDAREMFEGWYNHSKNLNKSLLLSSESFFNLSHKMKKLLDGKSTLVISYQRDLVDYLLSVHNQLIKRHNSTLTFEEYIKSLLDKKSNTSNLINKSFFALYQEWEESIGSKNLIVRPYLKKYFTNDKIEYDILNILSVPSKSFRIDDSKTNVSYTPEATELKRMLNHILVQDEQKLNHKIDIALQNYSDIRLVDKTKSELPLSKDTYANLVNFVKKDIELLNDNYIDESLTMKKYTLAYNRYNYEDIKELLKLITKETTLRNYIYKIIHDKLNSKENLTFSIYKLAELLEIENLYLYESREKNIWFNQQQLHSMVAGKYKEPDFLRDIATLLLKKGDIKNADAIISRALQLRPNGPGIIKIKEEVKELL